MIQQGSHPGHLAAKTMSLQRILVTIRTISVQGQTELVMQAMPTTTSTPVATTTALVMILTPWKTLVHHQQTVVPLPQEAEAVPQEALVRGLILMLLQHLFTMEASVTLQEFGL